MTAHIMEDIVPNRVHSMERLLYSNFCSKMEKENEFLSIFFTHVSHFAFDKAKTHVDKERVDQTRNHSASWSQLLSHLLQLGIAEKSYIELGSLNVKNKGFLRKDSTLRAVYDNLRTDIKKLDAVVKSSQLQKEPDTEKSLLQNIVEFISARIDLIDFYEKMHLVGTMKIINYSEIHSQIQALSERHIDKFDHIALAPVKALVILECDIIINLLNALNELKTLQFLPTLCSLYFVHTRLTAWEASLQNRETWKLSFGTSFLKGNPMPLLFQWLVKLKQAILSKFSLYFYTTLAQQTTSSEMRQLCAKQQVDYINKLQSFQRRYDATVLSIIFDKRNINNLILDKDYFNVIISYPSKLLPPHLENFESIVSDKSIDINIEQVIFKSMGNELYTISLLEENIYFLIIFDSKYSVKDSNIAVFVSEISQQLRCTKNFLGLKYSVK